MHQVNIFNTLKNFRPPTKDLCKLAEIVLKNEKRKNDINLIFIADKKMTTLNQQYRNKNKTTDVLSFSLEDDSDPLLGEIYISVPVAKRNAKRFGCSDKDEILKLFCHGLLHLCGKDHPTEKKRIAMNNQENKFLEQVGCKGAKW